MRPKRQGFPAAVKQGLLPSVHYPPNNYQLLLQRAKDCWEFHENRPTFIAVDWWEDGDVVAVVEQINSMSHWIIEEQ